MEMQAPENRAEAETQIRDTDLFEKNHSFRRVVSGEWSPKGTKLEVDGRNDSRAEDHGQYDQNKIK